MQSIRSSSSFGRTNATRELVSWWVFASRLLFLSPRKKQRTRKRRPRKQQLQRRRDRQEQVGSNIQRVFDAFLLISFGRRNRVAIMTMRASGPATEDTTMTTGGKNAKTTIAKTITSEGDDRGNCDLTLFFFFFCNRRGDGNESERAGPPKTR
jgi:hypothetical protein